MRKTSFGRMARIGMPCRLAPVCEVMHFDGPGKAHTHDVDEIAIAVAGSGVVVVEGRGRLAVDAGEFIRIPAGAAHWMEPDEGVTLSMLIGYRAPELRDLNDPPRQRGGLDYSDIEALARDAMPDRDGDS